MTALPKPVDLAIEGMTCAACVARVEKALGSVPGVSKAEVNLATKTARVEANGASLASLVEAIEAIGFDAAPLAPAKAGDHVPPVAGVPLSAPKRSAAVTVVPAQISKVPFVPAFGCACSVTVTVDVASVAHGAVAVTV